MTWSDPETRQTGDLITAAIWNADLVDNLIHLRDRYGIIWTTEHEESAGSGTAGDFAHNDSNVYYKFTVPDDFDELVSAEVAYYAGPNTSETYTVTTDYGNPSANEVRNLHSGWTTFGDAILATELGWGDISGALGSLQAGDVVGVRVQNGGSGDRNLVGLRILYSRV
jgi:hypothetical protein